jgi:type IV secretion system protein VirB2
MKISTNTLSNKASFRWITDPLLWMALLLFPAIALAEAKLPYEGGLEALKESFTGTVPFVISLAGIVGCGAMLIFGGEISGFMRTMVFIVLVVAVIVQASAIITFLKGSSGTSGRLVATLITNARTNV